MRYNSCFIAGKGTNIKLFGMLDKEIGHMCLIFRDCNNVFCMLDPQVYGIQPIVISSIKSEKELAEWFKFFGYRLIKLPAYSQKKVIAGMPCICTCVSFIKCCVGIFSFAITPRQLWNKFLRDGAQILV